MTKRENGVYYTAGDPFESPAFTGWAKKARLPESQILEPFAGANSLIDRLEVLKLCKKWKSFDIAPVGKGVEYRDTLCDFPQGFDVCVTNPPWLAKNSATRRGLAFPDTRYDDLYKVALERCLANCQWIAALVPESFIRAGLFHERLGHFVSLTGKMFNDTENPVGLALFEPNPVKDVVVWRDEKKIGTLRELEKNLPKSNNKIPMRFNAPEGNVGLIAIDNTKEASIRFCHPAELKDYKVRETCRSITRIEVSSKICIDSFNHCLKDFRDKTQDVLLTSFKGLRKDKKYRRRLDWDTAKKIINYVSEPTYATTKL